MLNSSETAADTAKHEAKKEELFAGTKVRSPSFGNSERVIERSRQARKEKARLLVEQSSLLDNLSASFDKLGKQTKASDTGAPLSESNDEENEITPSFFLDCVSALAILGGAALCISAIISCNPILLGIGGGLTLVGALGLTYNHGFFRATSSNDETNEQDYSHST